MALPGFNAEAALGPPLHKYRGRNFYGDHAMPPVSPQQLDDADDMDEDDMGNGEDLDDEGFEDEE